MKKTIKWNGKKYKITPLDSVWNEIPNQVNHDETDPSTGYKVGWYEQRKINTVKRTVREAIDSLDDIMVSIEKLEPILPTPQCRDVLAMILSELNEARENCRSNMGIAMKEAYLEGDEYDKYMDEWNKAHPTEPLDVMMQKKIEALEKELAQTKEFVEKYSRSHYCDRI